MTIERQELEGCLGAERKRGIVDAEEAFHHTGHVAVVERAVAAVKPGVEPLVVVSTWPAVPPAVLVSSDVVVAFAYLPQQ